MIKNPFVKEKEIKAKYINKKDKGNLDLKAKLHYFEIKENSNIYKFLLEKIYYKNNSNYIKSPKAKNLSYILK